MIIKKNPHDAFFKEFFGAPRPLRHLLEQVLPAELFRQIDLTTLRIEPGSYLDKEGGISAPSCPFSSTMGASGQ